MNMYWIYVDTVLVVTIIFGNITTLIIGGLSHSLNHKLFVVTSNKLLLSLAISDLCVGFGLIYDLAFYFSPSLSDHKFSCLLRFVFLCCACIASLLNIISVAVNRYIAIIHPIKYPKYINKKVISTVMVVNWCIAIIISTMPLYWNKYQSTQTCKFNNFIPSYFVDLILIPMFSIIWISIIVLYWNICKKSKAQTQRLKARLKQLGFSRNYDNSKSNQVVLSILGCFTLCWLPYVIISFIQFSKLPYKLNPIMLQVAYRLAVFNSSINPLIYAWNNPIFRQTFRNLAECIPLICNKQDVNSQALRQLPIDTSVVLTKINNDIEQD